MRKLDIKKIVESMKPVKNVKKPIPTVKDARAEIGGVRIRDMRQESKDIGSYGASEYFKEDAP